MPTRATLQYWLHLMQSSTYTATGPWAFERYEVIRHRLPRAEFPVHTAHADNLAALRGEFDAFVFDSFGVLNVGETPVPGARECLDKLRADGKHVAVLTNGATEPLASLEQKYANLGFAFANHEIISSREVLANTLHHADPSLRWGVAAPGAAIIEELPGQCHTLRDDEAAFEDCDGFILLSSQDWDEGLQARLLAALSNRSRPLLVGNPDLVAPRENGFSLEPGAWAHELADALGLAPSFFGKPFANAFEEVVRRLGADIDPKRIAMVGDTLHTDILGGAAAGWRTVLVTDHGVLAGLDVAASIESSGIIPDFIIPGI